VVQPVGMKSSFVGYQARRTAHLGGDSRADGSRIAP